MISKLTRTIVAACTLFLAPAVAITACGDDEGDTGNEGGNGPGEGICLLNNCSADEHCFGCDDGRNTCLEAENRCVACDPNTGEGCPEGEECSPFGICVPEGLTCPTDGDGNPTVVCSANSDCKACSPMHQVCDTATGKCQACTETNTQHCLQSDICVDTDGDGQPETCSPKCPAACDVDNDCSQCGPLDANNVPSTRACFNHRCAECSDTFPCPAGHECVNGVCKQPCGQLGADPPGTCMGDEDCVACGDGDDQWTCRTPINSTRGQCVPPINGCSDLGGLAVLPAPYDQVTNTCSMDSDCANVGVQYDVGKAIQDLVGGTELDLGFASVTISSPANVEYPMPICIDDAFELPGGGTCGICVPCEVDSDCQAINVDQVSADLFKDEPLAQIAFALLADLLWGDKDHNLNFFCLEVAGGYGACIPCANPLSPCGGSDTQGSCDHGPCDTGTALGANCGTCEAAVCAEDSFCCDTAWDSVCVGLADTHCANICTNGDPCAAHDECTAGTPLQPNCSQCAQDVCAADPFCCDTSWDPLCVAHATDPMDADFQASCTAVCP